ncbi:hypothetical protein NDU88_002960 [Pleurodeles waltl]|uniref:Uncharacterized protein n=1 Tax=Pleurodeles waltl TaxID=8319 RepID=A0AAV7RGX3_PLEWA|nr:hypothetical protein NDU88_002960 [Pleurodeles waltl]
MTDPTQEATMEHILQEITVVGRRLEGMDSAMTSLTAEMKSMCLDIAGFQSRVTGREQQVTTMEDHINTAQDRDQELLYLRSKLTVLENRSHRDICFFGFPEHIKDCQKAFLAFGPRLRQLEMKYGLFELARMWFTNNGVYKDFYEAEDLHLFLDGLLLQSVDTDTPAQPQGPPTYT